MHGEEHLEFASGFSPWLAVAVSAALAVLGAFLWLLWTHRPRTGAEPETSDGKSPAPKDKETEVVYGEHIEIFGMLTQKGGPMSQTEISEQLRTEPERIAKVLTDMEARGIIERRWDSDKKTFIVALREW